MYEVCKLCTIKRSRSSFLQCTKCKHTWCDNCNNNLIENGVPFTIQNQSYKLKIYKCPYCRTRYIEGSRLLHPVRVKTSSFCVIS